MKTKTRILAAVFLSVLPLCAYAQAPRMTTFNAAGHPKARGITFTIAYPPTWDAREGKRPHVVQMFVSPDPSEFLHVSVDDLENSDKTTHAAAVSKEGIKSLLPETAQLLTHTLTKLDGEVCAMCECIGKIERAGITLEERVLLFVVPHQGKVIVLWGAIAGLAGSSELPEKFLAAKPRFQGIAATLFLPEKWTKTPQDITTLDYSGFVDVEIGGLKLKLPKNLSSLAEENVSSPEVESLKKFTCVWETRSIIIKHFVFKKPNVIDPQAAASLTEEDLKKQSGFASTKREIDVDGVFGLVLDTRYDALGATAQQTVLFFSRDNELWEIHVFGVNEQQIKDLDEMKTKIFQSIKLKR
jgi:hypothetical protein